MSRLVHLEQDNGQPLMVNPEYVVAVWQATTELGGVLCTTGTEICVAGMAPFRLRGTVDDVVAGIDVALDRKAQSDG